MVEFKTTPLTINKGASEIFNFLSDFQNFGTLLPSEITNWQSSYDHCSFTLGGFFQLNMIFTEKIETQLIVMSSKDKMPFDYFIKTIIETISPNQSIVRMSFHADMPQMWVMAASGIIEGFIDKIMAKLELAFED